MKPRFEYEPCPDTSPHPKPHTWNRVDDFSRPIFPTLICDGISPVTNKENP